ncbi:MAG: SprB repeat-containing protein [Bacteroidia bacterium]|nr:SprB repeat-containing protein [Bacteroidia bacterium]
MKFILPVSLLLLAALRPAAQNLYPFPDPWTGANKTAVACDSMAGEYFIATAQSFNPHNRWKLFRWQNATQSFDSLAGSGFSPPVITHQMIYASGKLYLLQDRTSVRCFDVLTRQWVWTLSVDNPGWERINDLTLSGDTLYVAGDFSGLNTVPRWSIAAIHIASGTVLTNWDPSLGGLYDFTGVNCLESSPGMLFAGGSFTIGGRQNLLAVNTVTENILPWSPQPNDSVLDLERSGNYLYVSGRFTVIHGSGRNRIARINLPSLTLNTLSIGANNLIDDIEIHPGLVIMNGSFNQIGTQGRAGLGSVSLLNNLVTPWNPSAVPRSAKPVKCGDVLFICRTDLPAWDVYCLPPAPGSDFLISDSVVCKGDSVLFVLSPSSYSTQFTWSYSGSGVVLFPQNDSCTLYFSSTATSGVLSATPFSSCGAAGIPINTGIQVNNLPACSTTPSLILNCLITQVWLSGTGDAGTVLSWNGPQSCTAPCDSLLISLPGNYVLHCMDTLSACMNTDTCIVTLDTLRPDVEIPTGNFTVGCAGSPILLDGSTLSAACTLWWHDAAFQNFQPDPAAITNPGVYYLVVTDTLNGCKDSAWVQVGLDLGTPNSILISIPNLFPSASAYFTCITDSILLDAASDSQNVRIEWRNLQTLLAYPDPYYATGSGVFRLIVTDTLSACADSSQLVLLSTDTLPPSLQLPLISFSCSDDSLLLDAITLTPTTSLSWITPGNDTIPDSTYIQTPGNYIASAVRSNNGCRTTDTLVAGENFQILFYSVTDTLLCRGDSLTLVPDPLGNFGPLSYLWDDNSTSGLRGIRADSSGVFWVQVSDSSGCSGTDTFYIAVDPPITDSVLLFSSCNGSDSGTAVILAAGGIPPYEYSTDGGNNFQSSNVFAGLPYGIYPFAVRDSPGCIHRDTLTLTGDATPPATGFLCTEDLFVGDTVVLVDLSLPPPDSTVWQISGPVLYPVSAFPVFICSDTGTVSVLLRAHYPGCLISVGRTFLIRAHDSTLATLFNANGILRTRVFPNPNQGVFTIEVELEKKQDLRIQISDTQGNILYTDRAREQLYYTNQVSFASPAGGIYRLEVFAEFDHASFLFIISP